jgi:purine-cytosine permease-like protein
VRAVNPTLLFPLIFLSHIIGAILIRQITISNTDRIKKYVFLKNGAMNSILFSGMITLLNNFCFLIPKWLSPIVIALLVAYFFLKSKMGIVTVKSRRSTRKKYSRRGVPIYFLQQDFGEKFVEMLVQIGSHFDVDSPEGIIPSLNKIRDF